MLLTASWAFPLAGAILLLLIPNRDGSRNGAIRWLALAVSVAAFALTLAIWLRFDPTSAEFQRVERVPWIPAFGIDYFIGIDGGSLGEGAAISLFLFPLLVVVTVAMLFFARRAQVS